jgi:hypothetical protein
VKSSALSVHHPNLSAEARQEEMAKTKAEKMAATMRKEWWVSKSTDRSVNELVAAGVLHNQELAGWWLPVGDSYPDPQLGEIIDSPVHPFLQGLLLYYKIGICNLHPNSILLVSVFIHLCEAYGGIQPHFDLFCYLFCLRKKGS